MTYLPSQDKECEEEDEEGDSSHEFGLLQHPWPEEATDQGCPLPCPLHDGFPLPPVPMEPSAFLPLRAHRDSEPCAPLCCPAPPRAPSLSLPRPQRTPEAGGLAPSEDGFAGGPPPWASRGPLTKNRRKALWGPGPEAGPPSTGWGRGACSCVLTRVYKACAALPGHVGPRGPRGPSCLGRPGRHGHLCWQTLSGGWLGTGSENLSLK